MREEFEVCFVTRLGEFGADNLEDDEEGSEPGFEKESIPGPISCDVEVLTSRMGEDSTAVEGTPGEGNSEGEIGGVDIAILSI